MPMQAIVFASLIALAAAGAHVTSTVTTNGNPGCPCIQTLPAGAIRKACPNKPFKDAAGECVEPTVTGVKQLYPTSYGTVCQKHIDPGHADCYDVAAGVERPAPTSGAANARAGWCDDPWCYIDPCNCNSPKTFKSDYFADLGTLTYTYLTCGDKDSYTGAVAGSSGTEASTENCPSQETSGAESIKPFLSAVGLLFLAATVW